MILRSEFLKKIKKSVLTYPVTALIGSRQSGKTTLAKQIAQAFSEEGQSVTYFDLEYPEDLIRLDNPQRLLEPLEGLIVIDEVQRKPDLFPLLRVFADRRPLLAKFLVLGSASSNLLKQTSESLAGRIQYIELPGFGIDEIDDSLTDRLWIRGGYPLSFLAPNETDSFQWRENFIQTFLEKDMGLLGIRVPPIQLWRFWQMAAHFHGQIWNHSELARSLGVSHTTIKSYLDLLTDTFMVRQLPPWFNNLGKTIVKSPKFYIRDSGLLHTLFNVWSLEDLRKHPKLGASWEGFALEQIIRLSGQSRNAFFWATHGGAEMDLIINMRGELWGFEVKFADTPKKTRSMTLAIKDLQLNRAFIIYPGKQSYFIGDNIQVVPLTDLKSIFPSTSILE